uniref:Uncharacterized protein n=1 Tax=Glossina austeni TaxID=7395 RepID=A0A1A9UQ28_GLOAU
MEEEIRKSFGLAFIKIIPCEWCGALRRWFNRRRNVAKPAKGWEFNFLIAGSTVELSVFDAQLSFPVFWLVLGRNYSSHQFSTYSKLAKHSPAKSSGIELRLDARRLSVKKCSYNRNKTSNEFDLTMKVLKIVFPKN